MIFRKSNIIIQSTRKDTLSSKGILILVFIILFFHPKVTFSQVITNTGAAISVKSGTVVNSKDYENTVGSLGNNGTINLSGIYSNNGLTGSLSNNGVFNLVGDYFNAGLSGGNGLFNLQGNWTNMGSFNPGTSTVTFNGTANQTITHASTGENFYKLIINNPGRIITQIASTPSSLTILNDLDLTAGTLSLHSSTSNLTIGGKATINGSLIYNNTTKQITSITDILSGSGTIDMSGGNLPHFLNLGGATNIINSFITSPTGASTVNYNGTNQTVFAAANYRNLVISNSGVKTLQGNSVVGLRLNISGGTFDLGTVTSTLNVQGGTVINGGLSFNGTIFKTVTLNDSLTGSGFIDMSGGNQAHLLNLWGSINSLGTYSSGTASTVDYKKNGPQTTFSSSDYNNLKITGTGLKTLTGDITAKGILTMSAGDIDANGNILKVSNPAITAIVRTNGTVIGRLQRAVGTTGSDYLYPIGSAATYNPMKIRFHILTSGPVTAQFKVADIGNVGLPLDDNDEQIYDRYTDGYWTLTSVAPMASNNYNVSLTTAGFTGIDLSSRIIKRTDAGALEVDGKQDTTTVILPEMKRDSLLKGISVVTTDLAIGKGRPRITSQPANMDICETFNAYFQVNATGHGSLSYRWYVDDGSGGGFTIILNGGVYSGATTNKLVITGAPYSMNQYRYQCKITDAQGNYNITNPVILTVNKIPIAVATPPSQPVCNGVSFTIAFSTANSVAGTLFNWSHNTPAGITTSLPSTGSDFNQVSGIFTNNTDNPITVTFAITPVGPVTTHCVGTQITATVTINPTPRLFPIPPNTIQCDSTTTNIQLQSPSTFTSGFISFNYTVATSGPVTGFTSPSNGLPNNHTVADKLINHSDIYQDVIYSVVPVSPVTGCAVGATKSFSVRVNPTPRAKPFNPPVISTDSSICFAGTTNILLTTPTEMTSGNILFDFKVTVSGSSGVVSGDTTHATGKTPGYFINRSYQNSSDTIQSVFFSITPRVDNAVCNKGPAVVSQIRVHARTLQSLVITKPLTCAGGAGLAALRAVISKGANPYQVIWDGPFGYHKVDSLDITNLGTGKYTVRVTDNRNCFRRDSISLSPVAAKAYISAAVIPPGNYNISCIGSADGTISIAVTGGITPPYIYWLVKNDIDTLSTGVFSDNLNITDPTTYRIINNLGAASYTLIIKDINGCVDLKKIIFRTPPPMVNWFSKSTFGAFNVSCKGYSDGYAKADSTRGGRGSYTYRWYTFNGNIPGPINTNRIDNIPAGKYYLETKDVLNCVKIDSITLTEPNGMLLAGSQLSKSTDNNFNISCNGGNDGFIKLNITGGSGIYIVTWTGPNGPYSTKDISGLVAGTYVATVADFYGCVLTPQPSFTLTQPTPLGFNASKSVAVDGINNINCAGGKGSITLSVSGGSIGNYTYLWSTTNGSGIIQGQRDQFALTAGDYTVVVTDLNGCSSSKNITLTQPLPVTTQLIPKHITCYPVGFSNGSINLTVAGGMGSYSFSWSNGATTEDIANLTQGLYKVIVLDGNGCQKKDSATIKLPPSLTISSNVPAFNGFNVSCYGLVDGSIKVTPTSGVAPFIYSWTGPGFTSSNQNISGLIKGQYTLMVTDSNQCKTSQIFNLNEPGKFSMDITPSLSRFGNYNLNCAGDSTAKITIDPVNGVGAVAYHWSDGNIAKVRTGLPAGKYNIIILDQNNCHADSSITLRQPDSIKTSFVVRQAFCPDSPDGEIQLHVSGGVIVSDYMYRWSDNSTTQTLSDVLRGYYKVLVTDANNCSKKDSVLMEPLHETCLVIPNAISPNNDNINDVWNIGMIYLYPKVEIKVFNRWGETIWRSEPGYPHPWDGRSNGALLPIDSYYYIIDLHNGSRPISGSITIVR